MFESYDQDELLGYIEDALPAEQAGALRKRLEADGPVGELIEAMRGDRARLVAEPEPHLPVDFAAQLESLLVRPMLMEMPTEAGQYRPGRERRMHRRQRRMRAARRLSVAAGVGLVAVGVVWGAYVNFAVPGGQQRAGLDSGERGVEDEIGGEVEEWGVGDGGPRAIHHYPQLPGGDFVVDVGVVAEGEQVAVGGEAVAAAFLLVIRGDDADGAERLLTEVVSQVSGPSALVQNFSFEEARKLEEARLLDEPGQRGADERMASRDRSVGGGEGLAEPGELAQEQRIWRGSGASVEGSQQLHGERELAATYEQQLAFAARGATHTVTIRLRELQGLLAGLARERGQVTWLQLLPGEDGEVGVAASFVDREAVNRAIEGLRARGEDVLVHLPVRVVGEE